MNTIKIDKLIRSKRKTISLIVEADATLVVRAPLRTSLKYIENLVFKKRFWICEKQKMVSHYRKKEFVNGEGFFYLGEMYTFQFKDCNAIELIDGLYFPEKYRENAKEKMIEWYKQKAIEKITPRVELYSKITGWKYKSMSITHANKQWGSCGPSGSINFSWRLIMAPLDSIDYVVVHELAHIDERNHGARFWNNIKTILPDYKQRQKWFNQHFSQTLW